MFCPNCGTQLEDNALFCGSCGTRMSADQQPQQAQPQYEQPQYQQPQYEQPQYQQYGQPQYQQYGQPQAPKKNKTPIFIAIGAVAAVAVIALVLVLVLGGGSNNSAKGAIELYFDIMQGDADRIEDMAPKAVWDYMEDEYGTSLKDMKEELEDTMSMMEGVDIDFKIGKSTDLDKDLVKAIGEELADEYGIDADSVQEVKEYEVEMTAKIMGQSMTESQEVAVAKVDGSWYCIDYSDYGDGDVYADFLIAS